MLSAYAIINMATIYGVTHGDLNSGNILIQRAPRKRKTIRVGKKEFVIDNLGLHPIFIDFGRGSIETVGTIRSRHIKDDILILYSVLNNYIRYSDIKERYVNFVLQMMEPSKRLPDLFAWFLSSS